MTAVLLTVALLLQVVADPNEPRGSISGQCLSKQTNEPLKSASVQLSGSAHGQQIHQAALTGPDGAFSFQHLPPGSYSLNAEKGGYEEAGLPQAVPLDANQSRTGLDLKLNHAAAIMGRVLDADGQPVAGARVTAYRFVWAQGRRMGAQAAVEETDDRGVYRLFGLRAARYIIGAVPPLEENPRGEMDAGARAFYPSATISSQATPLNVRWGQELTEINVTLPRLPTFSVAGVVADAEAGGPCKSCTIRVDPIDEVFGFGRRQAGVAADGTYRVRSLPAGGYRVTAVKPSGREHVVASRSVYVTDRNLGDVHLVAGAARTVSGRLVFESPPSDVPKGGVVVFAMRQGGDSPKWAWLKPDFTFQVAGLSSGVYQVAATLPGGYLKAVKIAGVDLPGDEIEIPEDGTLGPIELVIAFDSATVSGRVKASESEGGVHRVTAAEVVLIPKENQSPFLSNRGISTDPSGGFNMPGVPPGSYTAFAFPSDGTIEWHDPEVRRQFQQYGKSLDLGPRKRETIELTLVPPRAEQ